MKGVYEFTTYMFSQDKHFKMLCHQYMIYQYHPLIINFFSFYLHFPYSFPFYLLFSPHVQCYFLLNSRTHLGNYENKISCLCTGFLILTTIYCYLESTFEKLDLVLVVKCRILISQARVKKDQGLNFHLCFNIADTIITISQLLFTQILLLPHKAGFRKYVYIKLQFSQCQGRK